MIKRHVVRGISWDIFRITSHGIYFSSHAILNTSDGILFSSEKFGDNSENIKKKSENFEKSLRIRPQFVGGMILNSRRKHSVLPSLLEILTKIRGAF